MMMTMASQKRSHEDVFLVNGGGNGGLNSKRLKGSCGRMPISIREKKDKIGERVNALQQLVSPFGKTDTASVLEEATAYIKFLHEQIQVLSAPYLQKPPSTFEYQGLLQDHRSLRSRGLCLVPMAYSLQLTNSNGADIWAPINTSTGS